MAFVGLNCVYILKKKLIRSHFSTMPIRNTTTTQHINVLFIHLPLLCSDFIGASFVPSAGQEVTLLSVWLWFVSCYEKKKKHNGGSVFKKKKINK